jgi:hypothetical protein
VRKFVILAILLGLMGLFVGCSRSLLIGRYDQGASNLCEQYHIENYENKRYNQEVGANDFLLFSVASLNSYKIDEIEPGARYLSGFSVEKYDSSWKMVDSGASGTGLYYNVYWRDADTLDVMIAIRGTEGTSFKDWYSNFSWITQILPVPNQYDVIRQRFQKIREKAFAQANGRTVRFVATGHSLGGGLAQHLAYAFPCVSAVVFNTSPVSNRHNLTSPVSSNRIVHIYEKEDELTNFRNYVVKDVESDYYKKYVMKLVPVGKLQHSMSRLSVGMSRMVSACQRRVIDRTSSVGCAVSLADRRAAGLYCSTYASVALHPDNFDPEACGPRS